MNRTASNQVNDLVILKATVSEFRKKQGKVSALRIIEKAQTD